MFKTHMPRPNTQCVNSFKPIAACRKKFNSRLVLTDSPQTFKQLLRDDPDLLGPCERCAKIANATAAADGATP